MQNPRNPHVSERTGDEELGLHLDKLRSFLADRPGKWEDGVPHLWGLFCKGLISNRFQCEDWRGMLNKKEPCSDCKSEMIVVVDAAALMRLS